MKMTVAATILAVIFSTPMILAAQEEVKRIVEPVTAAQRMEEAKARMGVIKAQFDTLNLALISTRREIEALEVLIQIETRIQKAQPPAESDIEVTDLPQEAEPKAEGVPLP